MGKTHGGKEGQLFGLWGVLLLERDARCGLYVLYRRRVEVVGGGDGVF